MTENALLCLLYPCMKKDKKNLKSIDLFNDFTGIVKTKEKISEKISKTIKLGDNNILNANIIIK